MSLQTKIEFLQHALTVALKVLETVIKIVDVVSDKITEIA